MHLTSSPAIWYAARASGVAAYVVLTVTVALGMAMGGKAQSARWPKFATMDVHRFGGLLVGSLIGVHVGAIALDSFMPFSLRQLVVPLASTYRPLWTGLGIGAAELLLALAITNRYQKRLPYRVWRRVHYLNFAVWAAASLHGMFAGTDRSATWLVALYAVSVAGVGATLLWRIGGFSLRLRVAVAGGLAGVVVLQLLTLAPSNTKPRPVNAVRFAEPLTGQVIRNGTNVKQIVSFLGGGASPQKLLVRADLLVSPSALEATSLQLEYLPSGEVCRGHVTSVGGTSFAGRCVLPSARVRWVDASWTLAGNGSGVVGTIRLHA